LLWLRIGTVCGTLVNAVMNLRVPWYVGNFLTSWQPVSSAPWSLTVVMSRMTEQQRQNEYLSTWYTTARTADNLRRHSICAINVDLTEVFEVPPLHKSSMRFPENSS
jgi:hypothetical protein